MTPMLMKEFTAAEPGMLIGVDYGAGVRQMVELLEPFQETPFSEQVCWKAKVWRSCREIGPRYDGATIRITPNQRILIPRKQR